MKPVTGLDVVVAGVAESWMSSGGRWTCAVLPVPAAAAYRIASPAHDRGNVSNCGIDLAKLGFRVGRFTRVGDDTLGEFPASPVCPLRHGDDGVIVDRSRQTSATFVPWIPGENGRSCTPRMSERFPGPGCARLSGHDHRGRVSWPSAISVSSGMRTRPSAAVCGGQASRRCEDPSGYGGQPEAEPASLQQLLPSVDIFFPSLDEARILTGETTPGRSWGNSVHGVPPASWGELGAQGCYVDHDREAQVLPARHVRNVVDTTGAGDAFVAGFLAATLRGYEPFASARSQCGCRRLP